MFYFSCLVMREHEGGKAGRRGGGEFGFVFVCVFCSCVHAHMSLITEILQDEHLDTDSTLLLRFWPKYKAACAFMCCPG